MSALPNALARRSSLVRVPGPTSVGALARLKAERAEMTSNAGNSASLRNLANGGLFSVSWQQQQVCYPLYGFG